MKFRNIPYIPDFTVIPEGGKLILDRSGMEVAYVGGDFGPEGDSHLFIVEPNTDEPQALLVHDPKHSFLFGGNVETVVVRVPVKEKQVFFGIKKEYVKSMGRHLTSSAFNSKEALFQAVGCDEAKFRETYHVVSAMIEVLED